MSKPLKPQHFTTQLETIFQLTPTVRTFRLRFAPGERFTFQAGQYCMVEVPQDEAGKVKKKAYSIASAPHEADYFDLCVKKIEGGLATSWFWTLEEGSNVNLAVPYGTFLLHDKAHEEELVFVATGTGIAPLRSMIRQLYQAHPRRQAPITLIFGVRHEEDIFYLDEWTELEAEHPEFRFMITLSQPRNDPKSWPGYVGYVQNVVKQVFGIPGRRYFYICGLSPMIKAVEQTLLESGYHEDSIHYEKYA